MVYVFRPCFSKTNTIWVKRDDEESEKNKNDDDNVFAY